MTTKKNERNPAFDKALAQLEEIVQDMEGGSLPLEKMMEQYEKGMELIALCSAKLDEVERKIEIMVKKDGKTVAVPFVEDNDKSDGSGPENKGKEPDNK